MVKKHTLLFERKISFYVFCRISSSNNSRLKIQYKYLVYSQAKVRITRLTLENYVNLDYILGSHVIYLTASNKFSSANTSAIVSVLSKIKEHDVSTSKSWANIGENVELFVKIKGGNNIKLKVDFGDGTMGKYLVNDAYSKHHTYYNITHK